MRRHLAALGASALAISTFAVTAVLSGAGPVAAASTGTTSQGVSATTIRVGIPYVDLSAVRKFGITLDHGNYPDAYDALFADLNAHGGIDGRKLVPYLVAVNPVGTAPSATACTELAQDDKVFVVLAPQQPDCYLTQYGVPTINGISRESTTTGGTPNFTMLTRRWRSIPS